MSGRTAFERRRRSRRAQARYAIREVCVDYPVEGRVVDVSESGMGIESSKQLMVGSIYIFRVSRNGQRLSLPGRVEWCRLTRTRTSRLQTLPLYRAGVAFTESPSKRAWQEAIHRSLDALQSLDGAAAAARVRIRPRPAAATV